MLTSTAPLISAVDAHSMRYSEINQTQLLQDAFHCYRRNNLVISQRSFSRRILGKPPTYYSSMINRNRKPSRAVLQTLLSVTKTILATFLGNPHFGKPYAVNLNHAYLGPPFPKHSRGPVQKMRLTVLWKNVSREGFGAASPRSAGVDSFRQRISA